jgi:hypothetical protein
VIHDGKFDFDGEHDVVALAFAKTGLADGGGYLRRIEGASAKSLSGVFIISGLQPPANRQAAPGLSDRQS